MAYTMKIEKANLGVCLCSMGTWSTSSQFFWHPSHRSRKCSIILFSFFMLMSFSAAFLYKTSPVEGRVNRRGAAYGRYDKITELLMSQTNSFQSYLDVSWVWPVLSILLSDIQQCLPWGSSQWPLDLKSTNTLALKHCAPMRIDVTVIKYQ